MGFGTYTDDIEEEFMQKLITFLLIGGVVALMIGLVAWRLANTLLRQIGGEPDYAAAVVRNIAQGDLSTEVPLQNGDQESLLHEIEDMRKSWRSWWSRSEQVRSRSQRLPAKLPAAIWIYRNVLNSRPVRWKKHPPQWKS
jgi:methyl-accepting chemotaxis protein